MNIVEPGIDRYLAAFAADDAPVGREMEALAAERDFPIVGPQVGRLLTVLALTAGARRVLELGSGFGYSALWFLRGMTEGGSVVLTEGSADNVRLATGFLDRAGFAGRFDARVGDGLAIAKELSPPFDVVFCDIDKRDYPKALPVARRLLRPGGLFVVDNLLWDGEVLDSGAKDPDTRGILDIETNRRVEV